MQYVRINYMFQYLTTYRIAGKFGRGSSANLVNRQQFIKLKPSKLVLKINNPLADLLIRQTFFCQMLGKSQLAKLFPQTFLLYDLLVRGRGL